MDPLSRRNLLRLAGAAGLAGAAVAGGDLSPSADAALQKRVRAHLGSHTYRPGDRMVLRVRENLPATRQFGVKDTAGHQWRLHSKHGRHHVWTAVAKTPGPGTVTVAALWDDGKMVRNERYRYSVRYQVVGSWADTIRAGGTLIGMNAPASDWAQRVSEVGPGLGARRIFADLAAGPGSQIGLVEAAHNAGLLPVVSYKCGGDIAGAKAGKFNTVAEQAATKLASYGFPTAVTFWHEPNPDLSGADYVAASKQILPAFKQGQLKVGPILNGWLLDNQQSLFASFAPDEMFDLWDWFGIDTYESGNAKPADRIPALAKFVSSRGADLPLGVGEYNGYSAATIAAAGDALLSTPNVWFGCVFNNTGGIGEVLTGDRLTAFRQTLADPRRGSARAL